ncbi:MAG: methylated-DNA--[protein]-cysteine S-methyltransferase [Chloroflexi bacterium]|nr:MAG: methylated-DNA--[protein]-cysteine S-methyltransferase [Chloroflexota bacterium]
MNNHWLDDYTRIEMAILFLDQNYNRQPSLAEVAASAGLSEYHFQRLFTRWAGISPKRFLQFVTKEHAKELLEHSGDMLAATYETGLSSQSRLHDLFVSCEAVTPGEYKSSGAGMEIRYGYHISPFGEYLLAMTSRGICGLTFLYNGGREEALHLLQKRWKNASLLEDYSGTLPTAHQIFSEERDTHRTPVTLILKGTNFQIKVWEALLHIPAGQVVSYENLAANMGSPKALRAVGSAVGANPINYIIPCHRVIRKLGDFGQYQSGTARKKAILAWEGIGKHIYMESSKQVGAGVGD